MITAGETLQIGKRKSKRREEEKRKEEKQKKSAWRSSERVHGKNKQKAVQ